MTASECPGGVCSVQGLKIAEDHVEYHPKCSCPFCVAYRRVKLDAMRPAKHKGEATPCNPLETAEDYRELIHRCDLQIWEIIEIKEMAENRLAALEG